MMFLFDGSGVMASCMRLSVCVSTTEKNTMSNENINKGYVLSLAGIPKQPWSIIGWSCMHGDSQSFP